MHPTLKISGLASHQNPHVSLVLLFLVINVRLRGCGAPLMCLYAYVLVSMYFHFSKHQVIERTDRDRQMHSEEFDRFLNWLGEHRLINLSSHLVQLSFKLLLISTEKWMTHHTSYILRKSSMRHWRVGFILYTLWGLKKGSNPSYLCLCWYCTFTSILKLYVILLCILWPFNVLGQTECQFEFYNVVCRTEVLSYFNNSRERLQCHAQSRAHFIRSLLTGV